MVDALTTDMRLAMRALARAPGFSVAVVIIIALGVGANSAVFTALDQTVIRSIPYRDPACLVMLWEDFSAFGVPKQRVSPGTYLDWRRRSQVFEGMAAYGGDSRNLSGNGSPEEVQGVRVTATLIPLLGVSPLLGRTFSPDEEGPGTRAVVLSYRLWQRRSGGDPNILGQSIVMNGESHEVIGVMPAGFDYPDRETEFWMPLGLRPELLSRRNSHFLKVLGRLRAAAPSRRRSRR